MNAVYPPCLQLAAFLYANKEKKLQQMDRQADGGFSMYGIPSNADGRK